MNIGVKINEKDINDLAKELKKIGKIIGSTNLQLHRAKRFKDYTVEMLSGKGVDINPISDATRAIQGGDHNPLYNTGDLARKMGVRPVKGNAAEAGYFENSPLIPDKDITYTRAAILAHTGYRIPASAELGGREGEKGAKVRAWLHDKGIHLKKSTHWLIVPARPFMLRSYLQYMMSGEDMKAVDEFLEKMMTAPMSDANAADPLKMAGEI
jgi:hypothetical protein